jgi:hypothetical protein
MSSSLADQVRQEFDEATTANCSGPSGTTVTIIAIVFGSIFAAVLMACACHIAKLYLNYRVLKSKSLCRNCQCQIPLDDIEAGAKPPPYDSNNDDDGPSEEDRRLLDDDPVNKA